MKTKRTVLRGIAAVTLMLATIGGAALAGATSLRTYVTHPVVIGDQLFAGGTVQLVDVGISRDRIGVVIDGVQVAVMSKALDGTRPPGSRPHLVFELDERGFRHLVAIRYTLKESDDPRTAVRELVPIHVETGLATVPTRRLDRPTEATASARPR